MGNLFIGLLLAFLYMNAIVLSNAQASPNYYNLYIYNVNLTRVCNTTITLTANGTFPGPTIYAEKGETIHVNVINNGTHGITIHWHGVLQPRNPWSDGTLNITQCYIQPGSNFTQKLIFSSEEGTVWYHAHSDWSMTTVHGPIVVYPTNRKYSYPIIPDGEQTIVLATWYTEEVMELYDYITSNGLLFPPADAFTINGEPGHPNYCSAATSFRMTVEYNKTYLLRVVNAILNEDQFFGIAGHNMTLVGHDGSYTKPLTTEYIRISPGQTMDVLFTANQTPGCYFMASQLYFVGPSADGLTNSTATAILGYDGYCSTAVDPWSVPFPKLPVINDTDSALHFTNAIRSLNSVEHPAIVPKTSDLTKNIIIHGGGIEAVTINDVNDYVSYLNNISFVAHNISILEAYSRNLTEYFDEDFPIQEEEISDEILLGTRVLMFNYADVVQIIFESADVHPMHIHGFNFYVVATGLGNFEDVEDAITTCTESTDPTVPCYNLVDPPQLNTVSIPVGGWVAIRFVADNPGVWFVHCHFERHQTTGMDTVFIVKNGTTDEQRMLPPPDNMPPCACNTDMPCLSSAQTQSGSFSASTLLSNV